MDPVGLGNRRRRRHLGHEDPRRASAGPCSAQTPIRSHSRRRRHAATSAPSGSKADPAANVAARMFSQAPRQLAPLICRKCDTTIFASRSIDNVEPRGPVPHGDRGAAEVRRRPAHADDRQVPHRPSSGRNSLIRRLAGFGRKDRTPNLGQARYWRNNGGHAGQPPRRRLRRRSHFGSWQKVDVNGPRG